MPSSKDVKELMAARRAGRKPSGVPQIDPAELLQDEAPLSQPSPSNEEIATETAIIVPAPAAPQNEPIVSEPKRPQLDLNPLMDIDRSRATEPFSTYAYQERKRQLKLEAIATGDDIWEIVDVALDEYFERRYGKKAKRPKS
ncbi:hypothetical protein [Streptomyces sp. V1I1]|uniref:hypothetical protein n=1 Tax=Streptomyces sp. V1I1 TaxID=3042272 RepID=UPI002789CAAF|nr:hypothetical protein [Streptomyces sp. V1I1]MDQ0943150.1 hypothetical protein [Streptomyces sp. V1I1]